MRKEIVMRGNTASGTNEVLEFSGLQIENKNMAYRLVEFELYPSTDIGGVNAELAATLTAAKTFEDPANPDFSNPGLIGTSLFQITKFAENSQNASHSVINDHYLITQNLIIAVIDVQAGSPMNVNWQCRFVATKMTDAEMAANNFKQYKISDGS